MFDKSKQRKVTPAPEPEWIGATWAETRWPDWVPAHIRDHLASFWREDWGRGPREWWRASPQNWEYTPQFGERAELEEACGGAWHVGRFVHGWNNMGWCVKDDGEAVFISTCGWPRETHTREALATVCECGEKVAQHLPDHSPHGPGCNGPGGRDKDCPCTLSSQGVLRRAGML